MNRRKFVIKAGIAGSLACIAPHILFSSHGIKVKNIGLQLYTVRDQMSSNALDTLKRIAQIGYSHVECAGYRNGIFYGYDRSTFKSILNDLGLKMYSGHTMTGQGLPQSAYSMTYKWEQYCEDAAFVGQKYIVCAYFMDGERKTADDYKKIADLFNTCAETAKKYGLQFCHHNHDFEFFKVDGEVPYDILLNRTDKELVKFEIDHYWTRKAGVDSIKLMQDNPGRFPLFHIKDMDNTSKQAFTEVGTGVIDWKPIFAMSEKAGMDLYFVEQDACTKMTPLESIALSFQNLNAMTF
jgi:sugar phosphate isomerase/epimerase